MSWIGSLLAGGASEILNSVDGLIGRFRASPSEKQQFKLQLEQILTERNTALEARFTQELKSKENILVAELKQGDSYTKRARPSVVYVGLIFIFLNYCLVPIVRVLFGAAPQVSGEEGQMVQQSIDVAKLAFPLPNAFWAAWGGIVGTWAIGRSAEKMGRARGVASAITGNPPVTTSLLDDAKG